MKIRAEGVHIYVADDALRYKNFKEYHKMITIKLKCFYC